MKKILRLFICLSVFLFLTGCNKQVVKEDVIQTNKEEEVSENKTMKLFINDVEVPVTWLDNETVKEIEDEVNNNDIVVSMNMYGGNEQYGSLGRSFVSNNTQTTTSIGDIVLYNNDNIVVFYGSNTWSYTRLGKMNLEDHEVIELLSNSDVKLTLSK